MCPAASTNLARRKISGVGQRRCGLASLRMARLLILVALRAGRDGAVFTRAVTERPIVSELGAGGILVVLVAEGLAGRRQPWLDRLDFRRHRRPVHNRHRGGGRSWSRWLTTEQRLPPLVHQDRKSTRLNYSH